MCKYIVIPANDFQSLAKIVNKYIYEGYSPQGGVCVIKNNIDVVFYQAMLMQENHESKS